MPASGLDALVVDGGDALVGMRDAGLGGATAEPIEVVWKSRLGDRGGNGFRCFQVLSDAGRRRMHARLPSDGCRFRAP